MRESAFAIGVLTALLAGCGRGDDSSPPEIRYGEDLCSVCGMILSDPRYASAALTTDDVALFDDIGELIEWRRKHPSLQVRISYVHDHTTKQWIRADSATFVKSPAVASPMGHGIAAFANAQQAAAFEHASGGEIRTFEELINAK
jgi:copper chaperone NosL